VLPSEDIKAAQHRLSERSEALEHQHAEHERIGASVNRHLADLLQALLLPAVILMGFWKGWEAFAVALAAFVAWTLYTARRDAHTPGAEPERAEIAAEEFVRHSIVAEMFEQGLNPWSVSDGAVVPADVDEWDWFWPRLDQTTREFVAASPKQREARVAAAKKRSLPARRAMRALAQEQRLKPVWWADLGPREA
jgi:hypothetical protein